MAQLAAASAEIGRSKGKREPPAPEIDEEVLEQLIKRLLEQDPVVRTACIPAAKLHVGTLAALRRLIAAWRFQDISRLREVASAHGTFPPNPQYVSCF